MAGQPVDVFVTGRLAAVGPRPPGKGRKLLQRVRGAQPSSLLQTIEIVEYHCVVRHPSPIAR